MHIFSRQGPQLNTLKRQWPSYLPAFSPQTRVPELWTSLLATVHQLPAEGAQWAWVSETAASLIYQENQISVHSLQLGIPHPSVNPS